MLYGWGRKLRRTCGVFIRGRWMPLSPKLGCSETMDLTHAKQHSLIVLMDRSPPVARIGAGRPRSGRYRTGSDVGQSGVRGHAWALERRRSAVETHDRLARGKPSCSMHVSSPRRTGVDNFHGTNSRSCLMDQELSAYRNRGLGLPSVRGISLDSSMDPRSCRACLPSDGAKRRCFTRSQSRGETLFPATSGPRLARARLSFPQRGDLGIARSSVAACRTSA